MPVSLPSRISLSAPAKLNLFFEVTGKRPDGYHDVETITTLVTLHDELTIETSPGAEQDVSLTCTIGGEAFPIRVRLPEGKNLILPAVDAVPTDERNLAVKAYRLLAESSDNPTPVRIELIKRIPAGAGLGGGSSDAAAVLFILNRLWNLNLRTPELARLAARLGSDVPLFFEKSPALGLGRGEITRPLDAADRPISFLIFKPSFSLSTAEVYRALDQEPPWEAKSSRPLAEALRRGEEGKALFPLFYNRLEATARRISPELDACFETLGALAPFRLTGSGSALYTVVSDPEEAVRLKAQIRFSAVPGKVFLCRSAASPLSPV